jgi:hypothetical protein
VVGVLAAPAKKKVANPSEIVWVGRGQHESTARCQVSAAELKQGLRASEVLDEFSGHDDIESAFDYLSCNVTDAYIEAVLPQRFDAIPHHVDTETFGRGSGKLAMQMLSTPGEVVHHPDVEKALAPN